jgi:hypothetical protein
VKLFEINDRYEAILAQGTDHETGDITDEAIAELDALEDTLEAKALACAAYLKGELCEAEAVEREIAKLKRRAQIHKNRAKRLHEYMAKYIPIGRKFSDGRCVIKWRASQHLEIEMGTDLPEQYMRLNTSEEPNKTAITNAIKDGLKVEGCWIQPTTKLVVE